MVINEKALIRCMKEAYKNQGYTVAVFDGEMMITGGYWLVKMAETETSNQLRSLIALHMRDVPKEGEAYKVIKSQYGPIVQRVIMETALGVLKYMEEKIEDGDYTVIRKTDLRYGGGIIWQNAKDLEVLMIDPRYEALLESREDVERVGSGLYADDGTSTVWALGMQENALKEKMEHLAKYRWVHG